MSSNTQALGGMDRLPPGHRRGYWKLMGGKFLVLSIAAHLLFLAIAAYCIIAIVTPPKPLVLRPSMPVPVPRQPAPVRDIPKQLPSSNSALQSKRVTVDIARDIIIQTPIDATESKSLVPGTIPGLPGPNPFTGPGSSSTFGPVTGIRITPWGRNVGKPGMLKGMFYDFKYLRNGQPARDVDRDYATDITHFATHGWNDSELGKYLKGKDPLFTSQIFYPIIESNDAPKAFNSPKLDSPGKWVVVYKGDVAPPETGIYHFVAAGDDDLIIRFNGQTVLFHCEHIPAPPDLSGEEYHYAGERLAYARSLPLNVEAGKTYPIEILIGDDTPAKTFAKVLIEKEGVNYQKDSAGGPILPVFAVDAVSVPGTETPAHLNGPTWQGKSSNTLGDMFGQ